MNQENSAMHSVDTSFSPTAMPRTSFTDLVGDSIKKEENDLPECKIKLEIVEELIITDNIVTSDPENLDTVLDFEVSQSKEQYLIKQEVFEHPEKHSDDKESLNINKFCKNEPTDFSEFICNLCKETFTCQDSFEEHSRTHSKSMVVEIKMEVFPCKSCHREFSVESELIQHIQAVHHSCGQCGGDFGSRESLEAHQLEHRKDAPSPKKPKLDDMQPTTAEVTSAAGEQENKLKDPLLTQTGENTFSCHTHSLKIPKEVMESKEKSILKNLLLKYTDEQPYSCVVCGKKFTYKGHYNDHMLTHTGEKPFSCDVCEKKFSRNSHLKTHKLTHTDEKPFSCDKCEKKFARNCHLKEHMLRHTGEKPFSCDECDKKFLKKCNLKQHQLRVHRAEYSEQI